jgi:hypothetical protein
MGTAPAAIYSVLTCHAEAVIVKIRTEKPNNATTFWSTQGLGTSLGMSQPTVARACSVFGLKPVADPHA